MNVWNEGEKLGNDERKANVWNEGEKLGKQEIKGNGVLYTTYCMRQGTVTSLPLFSSEASFKL